LRYLPSTRVLLVGVGAVALVGGLYAIALETSVFAVRKLEIVGGTAQEQSELRTALAPELGRSLLKVGASDIDVQVAKLPDLIAVTFDRAFPSTLKLRITAERPVMLLRRRNDTWLVSARGRVMRKLRSPRLSSLPRTYVPKTTDVSVGETLPAADGGLAAAAVAPLSRGTFPSAVRFVIETPNELTLKLASGLEIRLGGIGDLQLKIAIAKKILHRVDATSETTGYLDVSVPERPVVDSA
jgi:cell division septal protein FtsQ